MLPFSLSDLTDLIHRTRSIVLDAHAARQVTVKGLADYVTAVDFGVQRFLEQELPRLDSNAQLLAEEDARWTVDPARPYWVLDPIDGTTNLIHDYQQSCVAIAYVAEGVLQAAVVYNPFLHETYTAQRGQGAWCNSKPIHVSDRPDLAHSLSTFGTCPYHKERSGEIFARAQKLFERSEDVRRGGSAELDLCYVACGRTDCFIEPDLKPWDYCAGKLILEEAGGRLTNEQGEEPVLYRNCDVVASNGRVHAELLELLKN